MIVLQGLNYNPGTLIQDDLNEYWVYIGYMYKVSFRIGSSYKLMKKKTHFYLPPDHIKDLDKTLKDKELDNFICGELADMYLKGENIQLTCTKEKRQAKSIIAEHLTYFGDRTLERYVYKHKVTTMLIWIDARKEKLKQ